MKEILFAQRLADNDQKVREKTLKHLRKFLSVKTMQTPGISEDDCLKLWKGLFYCMYMADKSLVQEGLAEDISSLVHSVNNVPAKLFFIKAAFLTFAREWNGIDVFRINKFMMFVRRFLRQVFEFVKRTGWRNQELVLVVNLLETTVVRPEDDLNTTPLGLKLHVCNVLLEELAKVGGEDLENRVILAVIQPYLKVLALTKTLSYVRSVKVDIIRHLMRQSCLGQMYEEGLMVVADDPTQQQEQQQQEAAQDGRNVKEFESEDSEDEDQDPRAGHVDVYIPQLKPDFKLLADALLSIGGISRVHKGNREHLYQLAAELQDMAQGCYPHILSAEIVEDTEVPAVEEEKAVERLQKFNRNLMKSGKKVVVSSDEDSGVELGPSKADVQKQLKKKKFEKLKMKKIQANKKKTNEEKKILMPAEKQRLNKQQLAEAVRRSTVIEKVIQNVGNKAGITTTPMLDDMTPVQGKVVGKQSGFEVSLYPKKKCSADNLFVSAGFSVELLKPGKKRKSDAKLPVGPKKKKVVNSFFISTPAEGETKNFGLEAKPQADVRETKKMKKMKSKENEMVIDVLASSEALKSQVVGEMEIEPQAKVRKAKKMKKKTNKISEKLNETEPLTKAKETGKMKNLKNKENEVKNMPASVDTSQSATVGKTEKQSETQPMEILKTKELREKPDSSESLSQALGKPRAQPSKSIKSKELNLEFKEKPNEKPASTCTEGSSQSVGVIKSVVMKTKPQAQAIGTKKTNVSKFVFSESPVSKKKASSSSGEAKMAGVVMETPTMKSIEAKEMKAKTDTCPRALLDSGTNEKLNLDVSPVCEQKSSKETSVSAKMWAEPLKEGEYEIIIKSRKKISREKKNPLKARNTKTFKALPFKTRTININLKRNTTHEYSDYARTVKASPKIPFRADMQPPSPAIKKTITPTVIAASASSLLKVVRNKKQKKTFRMGVRRK